MKNTVKITCLLLIVLAGFATETTAQKRKADKDTQNWIYEIEPVAVGSQGSYLIKVWSYSKKPVIAIEQAKKNAVHNNITNCEFIAGDVLKVIDTITEQPDVIVLDPPRDGIHPKALQKIIDYGVDKLLYISCKPTSLARDLEVFLESGYHVERAVAVDQFPWTGNVETVALLSKGVAEKDT